VADVPNSTAATASRDRLGEVVAEYLAAAEGGAPVDREAILALHPEFAAELRDLFGEQDRFLSVVEPFRAQPREGIPGLDLKGGAPEQPTSVDVQARQPGGSAARDAGVSATARELEVRMQEGDEPLESGSQRRSFGDYELQKVLGRGGMGVVYRARQLSLDRMVALKMIRTGMWAAPEEVHRFRNEAQAIANLDHPGIVTIHEVGQCHGQHYLTMNLVEGASLARKLADFEGDTRRAARLVMEIARAVHHAHQRGILHRDLKPSNILIDGQGMPHVTDFGLAKRLHNDGEQSISGAVVGTPSYMSPEQAGGHRASITTATDVHGLGAILDTTLTGRPPFQSDSVVETLEMVQRNAPERPSLINARVDRDLETICLKCLEKDPWRRYDSAAALAEDLERWLLGEPILARPVGRLERVAKWSRRHPTATALVAMSGLAALTLVGLGVALFVHSKLQAAYAEKDAALARELIVLYQNRVIFAERALDDNNVKAAEQMLDECPTSLRGWEWHYLKRQCHLELMTLAGHFGPVWPVARSPDGRWIASGGEDKTVRIWEAETGKPVRTLAGHGQPVYSVA
jgi:hypothetical protein